MRIIFSYKEIFIWVVSLGLVIFLRLSVCCIAVILSQKADLDKSERIHTIHFS